MSTAVAMRRSLWRTWLKRTVMALLALFIGCLLFAAGTLWWAGREVRRAASALREEGFPTTIEELEILRHARPIDSELTKTWLLEFEAADQLGQQLKDSDTAFFADDVVLSTDLLSDQKLPELNQVLLPHQSMIDSLTTTFNQPGHVLLPFNLSKGVLAKVEWTKGHQHACWLLDLQCRSSFYQRDWERFSKLLKARQRLSSALKDDPILLVQFLRGACDEQVFKALAIAVAREQIPDSQLQEWLSQVSCLANFGQSSCLI